MKSKELFDNILGKMLVKQQFYISGPGGITLR